MKIRTGIDLVHIPRFSKLIKNEDFLNSVFHKSELQNFSPEHLSGIFAAKEAFFKAMPNDPHWLDIEIVNESGKPEIKLYNGFCKAINQVDLSISHDKDYATASVFLTLNE